MHADPGRKAAAAARRSPNLLVFLADDLGAHDLGCTGSTFYRTPVIDRLAAEGQLFTRGYAACPVCSPTRAEFLTGRYHPRGGVKGVSTGQERLNLDEQTIADAFKAAGYATGMIGKWHVGTESAGMRPFERGFDE